MDMIDSKTMAAVISACFFLALRWRWDYFVDLSQNPMKLIKFLVIWIVLGLILLRIFWQLKPNFFA
jgi:hypothetical protein